MSYQPGNLPRAAVRHADILRGDTPTQQGYSRGVVAPTGNVATQQGYSRGVVAPTGNVAPAAAGLQERVDALCGALNLPMGRNLVETVDKAVETIGMQNELGALALSQKVDACFQTISPMLENIKSLCMELNMTKSDSLTETVNRAGQVIGLSQDAQILPLPQKVDMCLNMLGTTRNAAPMVGGAPRRSFGPYNYGYSGPGPYSYGYGGYGYGYGYGYGGLYGGTGYYAYPYGSYYGYGYRNPSRGYYSPGSYYGYYNFPGGRRARLYDRAVASFYYDPYNAIGYSWDAWCDFFG